MNKRNSVLRVLLTRMSVDERTPFSGLEIHSQTSEFTSCVSGQLDEILKDLNSVLKQVLSYIGWN